MKLKEKQSCKDKVEAKVIYAFVLFKYKSRLAIDIYLDEISHYFISNNQSNNQKLVVFGTRIKADPRFEWVSIIFCQFLFVVNM